MSGASVYIVYLMFALGAAAAFCLLPRGQANRPLTVTGTLTAVLGGALTLAFAGQIPKEQGSAFFYLFAAVAIFASIRVISHPRPVYSAVYFVPVVLAVAALLILQDAEFLAVALVVIYAGAILVTYLFVIMLAQQPGAPVYDRRAREPFLAVLVAFVLTGAIGGHLARSATTPSSTPVHSTTPTEKQSIGNTEQIGAELMTRYVVALEIAGVLLLISMVGAIALSRKRVPSEQPHVAPVALGQVGREVQPF